MFVFVCVCYYVILKWVYQMGVKSVYSMGNSSVDS